MFFSTLEQRLGIEQVGNQGLGSAIGIFNSVIGFALVMGGQMQLVDKSQKLHYGKVLL